MSGDGGGRPPRVLLYADLRTSHALGWLAGLEAAGIKVRAMSSELLTSPADDIRQAPDPVAYIRRSLVARQLNKPLRRRLSTIPGTSTATNPSGPSALSPVQIIETALSGLRLPWQAHCLRRQERDFAPDLVHALRVPYEGLLALTAIRELPVVISSWGQDFTSQSHQDPVLRRWMRHVLPRASGIHVDALSDLPLAVGHGVDPSRPQLHAAGNFGVDTSLFYPERDTHSIRVVYPRGRRAYVNHRIFLDLVAAFHQDRRLRFLGIGLSGDPDAEALCRRLGPGGRLELTPELPRAAFASELRSASIVVSPARSDGTPNSLLEALACGAYILAGDVPSVAALMRGPVAGRLLDPERANAWLAPFEHALDSSVLDAAKVRNPHQVGGEYRIDKNVHRVPEFYSEVMARWSKRQVPAGKLGNG